MLVIIVVVVVMMVVVVVIMVVVVVVVVVVAVLVIVVLVLIVAVAMITDTLALWLRRPPRERKIPGSNPDCAGLFQGSSHTSDLKIGTAVAALPGAWRYRVSAGTGWPGVSIL